MRKLAFCISENKDADQLLVKREADPGNKLEGDWGEIVALGAEISP